MDSVKAVPGATYFKTEGKELKVDLSRGVKWSNTKQAWCAKTMFAGKKYTLGYFRDEELANQAYLFAVDAKRRGTIKDHLIRIGAHPPPELNVPGKRKRGRPRKYPRPEDVKKQKQLLPRYGSQAHKKLTSMVPKPLLRMPVAQPRPNPTGWIPNRAKAVAPGANMFQKPRTGSWPMAPNAVEEMNRAIAAAVQQQVAEQLRRMSPMLNSMTGSPQQAPASLSLAGSEVTMDPNQRPTVKSAVFVKREKDSLPHLSPEPASHNSSATGSLVPSPPQNAASKIIAASPTLNPTSFVLPVNMEDESDSDDEMFDSVAKAAEIVARSAPARTGPLSG